MSRTILLCAILLAGQGSAFAAAPDSDLPKPDPKGYWRVIGMDASHTTSKCLGSLVTIPCAIDTYYACVLRLDEKLCALVDQSIDAYMIKDKKNRTQDSRYEYRILSVHRTTTKEVAPSPPNPNEDPARRAIQPGDIELEIQGKDCTKPSCGRHFF